MNILLAAHHFPPRYNGGAEWRAYRTASALQRRGHQVRVVCVEHIDAGEDGVSWQDERFQDIEVRRLSVNLSAAPDRFRWEYDNPWIGEHFSDLLLQEPPDIFHMISGYLLSGRPLRVAQELEIPTVVTLTDFWFLCPRIQMVRSDGTLSTLPINPARCARCLGEEQRRYRIPGRVAPFAMTLFWRSRLKSIRRVESRLDFLRDTLDKVSAIIAPSEFLRSTFVEAGVAPEQLVFSRQGRDFPLLTQELLAKTPSDRLRIGYIGQINNLKGVHILFQAVRILPRAKLSVRAYGNPGASPHYSDQLRKIAEYDQRIALSGTFDQEAITDVFRELDVVVVPSLWYENSPNVILEAFAHHTPVIASDLGGMAELVTDKVDGLLFRPGDSAHLAHQLQRLIHEPGLLERLRRGIKRVRSLEEEIQELEALYQQISSTK